MTAGACSGNNFFGGTLQVLDLTMKGGGLYVSPSLVGTKRPAGHAVTPYGGHLDPTVRPV